MISLTQNQKYFNNPLLEVSQKPNHATGLFLVICNIIFHHPHEDTKLTFPALAFGVRRSAAWISSFFCSV